MESVVLIMNRDVYNYICTNIMYTTSRRFVYLPDAPHMLDTPASTNRHACSFSRPMVSPHTNVPYILLSNSLNQTKHSLYACI